MSGIKSQVYQKQVLQVPEHPWVVVGPKGVMWIGHAVDELHAWTIVLGWPSPEEIQEHKDAGFYAAEATITWKKPT
jgi:hypothetical protein